MAQHELAQLHAELVETRTEQLLQEAGVYKYAHPLESAVAYKDRLTALRADIKSAVTGRRAVTGSVDWTVNGSRSQGAKMVKDFSTLMLRAYNAEADNCVRTVKPHTVRTVRLRLDKTQLAIAKLGRTMSIAITDRYHQLRIHEIELTADYLAKVEAERELIRAQKEAASEEERARREYERQREKLLKEQAHYRCGRARTRRRSPSPSPRCRGHSSPPCRSAPRPAALTEPAAPGTPPPARCARHPRCGSARARRPCLARPRVSPRRVDRDPAEPPPGDRISYLPQAHLECPRPQHLASFPQLTALRGHSPVHSTMTAEGRPRHMHTSAA